jgi:hypothetical protein
LFPICIIAESPIWEHIISSLVILEESVIHFLIDLFRNMAAAIVNTAGGLNNVASFED